MRIQNHDVQLNTQGQDNQGIMSELSSLLAKMNRKQPVKYSNPKPTENKLIDSLCNTIFIQKKKIEELKSELHGMEIAKQINSHIKQVQELSGNK